MTQPFNRPPENDPLATFAKRPAVSFDPNRTNDDGTPNPGHPLGEWAVLQVDGYADMVQRQDRTTKKPMVYEDTGKPMMSMVLPVKEQNKATGEWEDKSLWSKVPGGILTALRAAQASLVEQTKDPSRRIGPGDTLAIRWSANGQKTDPAYSPPKIFEAQIKPGKGPDPLAANTSDNPFETAAAAPATPAAQPAAAPAATQPPSSDPWADTQPVSQPAQPAAAASAPAPVEDDPFGAPPAASGDTPPY